MKLERRRPGRGLERSRWRPIRQGASSTPMTSFAARWWSMRFDGSRKRASSLSRPTESIRQTNCCEGWPWRVGGRLRRGANCRGQWSGAGVPGWTPAKGVCGERDQVSGHHVFTVVAWVRPKGCDGGFGADLVSSIWTGYASSCDSPQMLFAAVPRVDALHRLGPRLCGELSGSGGQYVPARPSVGARAPSRRADGVSGNT